MPTKRERKHERYTIHECREQCALLESVVTSGGLATDEELRALRPGGPDNPSRGLKGWVRWYANLVRFNARDERGATGAADPEVLILQALRRSPVAVETVWAGQQQSAGENVAEGIEVPRQLFVHPKGADALFWFLGRDHTLARLGDAYRGFKESVHPKAAETVERILDEINYQHKLLVWAATTPGPWLPFDPLSTAPLTPPAWMAALDQGDLIRIIRAHQQVHGGRLQALANVVSKGTQRGDDDARASWAVFFAGMAQEAGIPASVAMRDYTLEEMLAQVRLAQEGKDRAYEAAKRNSRDSADVGDIEND